MFLGHKAAWDIIKEDVEDDDTLDATGTAASALADDMESTMIKWTVYDTSLTLTGMQYGKDWMEAQWMAMSEEEREAMEESGKGRKGGKGRGGDDDDEDDGPPRLMVR